MIINSRQAADILGVSLSTVQGLAKKGLLKPVSGSDKNKHKHFEAKDVRAFKAEYKPKKKIYNTNGHLPLTSDAPIKTNTEMYEVKDSPVKSFNERLKRLEDKIDVLIRMWS